MLKSTRTSKHITVAVFVYRMPLSRHIRLPYLPRRSEELYETIVRNSLLAQGKIHSLILHRELSSCIDVILLCRVVIGCFQPGLPQVLYVRDVIIIWGHIQITVRQLYMVAEPRNSTVYTGLD